jgi:hypothetical protein
VLSACAGSEASNPAGPATPGVGTTTAGTVRAVGRLAFPAEVGGAYTLLASRLPFDKRHLQRVEVFAAPRDRPDAAALVATVLPAQFTSRVTLEGLQAETGYRLSVKAWQPDTDAPDSPLLEAQDNTISITAFTTGAAGSTFDLDSRGGILVWLKGR